MDDTEITNNEYRQMTASLAEASDIELPEGLDAGASASRHYGMGERLYPPHGGPYGQLLLVTPGF